MVRYTKNSQIMASNKLGGFTAASLTVTSSLVWQDWYHHRVTDVSESYSWDGIDPGQCHTMEGVHSGLESCPGIAPKWTAAAAAASSGHRQSSSRTRQQDLALHRG